MKTNLRLLTATAIGIALFVVLSLMLQVPVFQNYYLCLGYVAMAVYCYSFGAFSGTAVGALGVFLYCLITSGMRGMPGWALGNVVIGIGLGLSFARSKKLKPAPLQLAVEAGAIILFTAVGILGVKSLVDSFIRSQPFLVRAGMNMSAFIADAAVLLLSLPICRLLDPYAKKLLKQQ
nr:ECF transporter S component [Lachnospiraceae bacterium]